mgnify:CR=1 FL=1
MPRLFMLFTCTYLILPRFRHHKGANVRLEITAPQETSGVVPFPSIEQESSQLRFPVNF